MNEEAQPKSLTKDEVNALPLKSYEGPIVTVPDDASSAEACAWLAEQAVIGFDTETRPAFRKGEKYDPSVLQLGARERVYLFLLNKRFERKPLRALLADPKTLKAGVAVKRDVEELQAVIKFKPAGFIDLAKPAHAMGLQKTGLRNLTAHLLGFRISKGAQRSNWARRPLTPKQCRYAAADAWLGYRLYRTMAKQQGALIKAQLNEKGNWY